MSVELDVGFGINVLADGGRENKVVVVGTGVELGVEVNGVVVAERVCIGSGWLLVNIGELSLVLPVNKYDRPTACVELRAVTENQLINLTNS